MLNIILIMWVRNRQLVFTGSTNIIETIYSVLFYFEIFYYNNNAVWLSTQHVHQVVRNN